jgi:MFS family permease
VAIWSVSAIVSLPGLAVSPILDDIDKIFPKAGELEVSMLESLPSLMIIPFMLLAGRWSVTRNKIRMLVIGTSIFLLSGIGCILSRTLTELIITSTILGIGAGIIIPLSTGLIVDYFTGDGRVRQLGISSAVNNLTLVVATTAVGYLADIEWHWAFAVYLLPAITLLLIPALSHSHPEPEPSDGAQNRQTKLNKRMIAGLMVFYFVITYLSLIVTFNTSYLTQQGGMPSTDAGVIISLFFLAIMAPGFILNRIVGWLGAKVNLWSSVVMGIGLIIMSAPHPTFLGLSLGAILTGVGYGVMQPIIYDKAATNAPPHLATLALSLVMVVNYLAILVAPFIIEFIDKLFHTSSHEFAYLINGIISLIIALVTLITFKHNRVLGSDD